MFLDAKRLKRILTLSLPIILAQISQNIVTLVDTAMVGTLGDPALAAAGMGSFIIFIFQSVLMGLSTGVQAQVSRRRGEGELSTLAYPLNIGLILSFGFGLIFTIILYFSTSLIFNFMSHDPVVVEGGTDYLMMRSLGIIFLSMNFSFRSYWNGVNRSHVYMSTLLFTNLVNVTLNYLLIFGKFGFPEMGIKGAGLATALSFIAGSVLYFILALSMAKDNGFLYGLPKLSRVKDLIKISLPNSIQQLLFSIGFTLLFWIIGRIGTTEAALGNILVNMMMIGILPGLGFGMANTSLVGFAIGENDDDEAYKWGVDVSVVCFIFTFLVSVPLWIFPSFFLGLFTENDSTVLLGRLPLIVSGVSLAFDSAGLCIMHALLGAGDSRRSMIISILCQWALFLPVAYIIGPYLGLGILEVWSWFVFYRIVQACLFSFYWYKKSWVGIKY